MKFTSVCFDFDSTLVSIEGIDVLAEIKGIHGLSEITNSAMEGKLDLKTAYHMRLDKLQLSVQQLFWLSQIYEANVVDGAQELVSLLLAAGVRVAIVSGGFARAIHPLAQRLGIREVHAVELDFTQGAGRILDDSPFLLADGKSQIVLQNDFSDCCFVGDGVTDFATRSVVKCMIPYYGIVKRTFVAECGLPAYGGKNLLGLAPMLLGEDGFLKLHLSHPQLLRKAADCFIDEGPCEEPEYSFVKSYRSRLFLVPGPTEVSERIKQADFSIITHRSREFQSLYGHLQDLLSQVLGWQGIYLFFASSATGAMESILAGFDNSEILSLQSGDFGLRWQKIAESLGHQCRAVKSKEGQGITVTEAINAYAGEKIVLLTASETANGTATDVTQVSKALKHLNPDVLVFADLVSAAAAFHIDSTYLDAMVFGSQKCLELPTGLGILWLSQELKIRLQDSQVRRGYYLDVTSYLKYHEQQSVPHTPAITIMQSLASQLHWMKTTGHDYVSHHNDLAQIAWEFCDNNRLEIFAHKGHRSTTVTAIRIPEHLPEIRSRAADLGVYLAAGYGELKPTHFRIGHMGTITQSKFREALRMLEESLL